MAMSGCLDPVTGDLDFTLNITGDITFTDITAAVLIMTNWSKTVNVTFVEIDQTHETEAPGPERPYSTSFTGTPRSLERKAVYLNPSEYNYRVFLQYEYEDWNNPDVWLQGEKEFSGPEPDGAIVAPLPRDVIHMHIFRDENGDVQIEVDYDKDSTTIPTEPPKGADENDTGRPEGGDPNAGEGSVPAIIPAENRNRIGTFVVINMTSTMPIDRYS